MKLRSIILIIALAIAAFFTSEWLLANYGFTKWMSLNELNAFMDTFKADQPGQPNYWDKGHWITAVEGRWNHGIPQYRIRYGDAPKKQGYTWYWYINQSQDSFNKMTLQYADDGFELAYFNKYQLPDGSARFQGVWHRSGKKH